VQAALQAYLTGAANYAYELFVTFVPPNLFIQNPKKLKNFENNPTKKHNGHF
jgi:hypothetical protein